MIFETLLKSAIAVPSTQETRMNSVAIEMNFEGLKSEEKTVYCLLDLSDSLTYGPSGVKELERVAQAGKQAWKIALSRQIPFVAIPFSSSAQIIPLDDASFDALATSFLARGGTALDEALKLIKDPKKAVAVIVTDGQPNSKYMVDDWFTANPHVPIYVIGMGTGADEDLLTWLARGDATKQAYCADAQTVQTKLEQFVVGGGSIAVDDANLTIAFGGGLEPLSIYRAYPKYAPVEGDWQNGKITIKLGAVGGRQAVCVDFIAPVTNKQGAVKISASLDSGGKTSEEKTEIEIPYRKEGGIAIDQEVAKWVDSAKRARRVNAIDRLAKAGKTDVAMQKAQELVQETRRGGGDLLGPMLKIMKEVRETGRVSDETRRMVTEELSDTQRKFAGAFGGKLTIKEEV